MSEPADIADLTDPEFLEVVAAGFAAVKVKPKGLTASRISEAHAGTAEFQARAKRLRVIAGRIAKLKHDGFYSL